MDIEQARQQSHLPVPTTHLLTSCEALTGLARSSMPSRQRPAYSRFATAARLPPHTAHDLQGTSPTPHAAWSPGTGGWAATSQTYSKLAQTGNLVLRPTSDFKVKAAIVSLRKPVIIPQTAAQTLAWCSIPASRPSSHGQIAFDFIQRPTGELLAIECNCARPVGFIYLADPRLVDALLGHTALQRPCPAHQPPTLAMLLYG